MLANGVKESTATAGTGTVTLSAVTGFVRFAQAFAVGDLVSYALRDGDNWEWGTGTVGASNTLARTYVSAKYESGVYSESPAAGLTLSGAAEVICTEHTGTASAESPPFYRRDAIRYAGDVSGSSLGSITTQGGRTYYVPFRVPRRVTLNAIGLYVGAAVVGSASVGIYGNAQSAGADVPGALLVSASAIDTNSTGQKTGSVSITLLPRVLYWAAVKTSANTNARGLVTGSRDSGLGRPATTFAIPALIEEGTGSTLSDPAGAVSDYASSSTTPGVILLETL